MYCYFCEHWFDTSVHPIACPACGYALGDEEPLIKEPDCSLVYQDGKYSIVEGFVEDSVFFGTFDECESFKEVLEFM